MAAMALGVLLAWYAYSTGPEKVLWATGAEEVTDPATDQQRQLVNVVEEMAIAAGVRSEEHTSELQSRLHLVCRLLLEKKKKCMYLASRVRATRRTSSACEISVRQS